MEIAQIITSLVSGGLAGGCVSALLNRIFHWRELRTRFYPSLHDLYSAYVLRMTNQDGRYLILTPGSEPSEEIAPFVNMRADFMLGIVEFNELKEARELRKKLAGSHATGVLQPDGTIRIDLMPEYEAISACFNRVDRRLRLR